MRALLLYNPSATTTRAKTVAAVTERLSSELKLDVEATKRRDHASYLAAGSVHEGHEMVVILGGDGTLNEVLQGIAHSPVKLGLIPGGSANVWARTLGIPADPHEATSALLDSLATHRERTVNLGMANGRYFAFAAGLGFDAEVVQRVDAGGRLKRVLRQGAYLAHGSLAAAATATRPRPSIDVEAEGASAGSGFAAAVCCNSDPYTYLGPWPARLCPQARLETGLDVATVARTDAGTLVQLVRGSLTDRGVAGLSEIGAWHDRSDYELRSDRELSLQLDGDYIGRASRLSLRTAPNALTVVA
jgi:diacylglycerol kinase family enzyme